MKLLLLFMFLSLTNYLFAQSIKGKLVNAINDPIELAEIIVYKNNIPLKSELSNIDGEFHLSLNKKEIVKMVIRYLDKIYYKKEVFIDSTIDLGIISIDNTQQLSEVVITAEKKLIEKKSDRIIYNVQSSVLSSGVSSDELLKNIPTIDPTSNGLKIIGKSNVLVMINDRLLNISGDDLINYLKTIRSENINQIEIITSPSAKYDASGNSGLINIKLKKQTSLGFDGTISTSFTQRKKSSIDNSINLKYSSGTLIVGYNIYQSHEQRWTNYRNNYYFTSETRSSREETERK